jgi:ethanolamine utilization cobalamin adenosyltransferase
MILVIRAKEVVQAKIAEAMERAAIKEAQDKRERDQEAAKVETTSAVVVPTLNSQAECHDVEMEDPEAITVASMSKEKKKKAPKVMLPPRTNLRSTPARQARALNLVQQ